MKIFLAAFLAFAVNAISFYLQTRVFYFFDKTGFSEKAAIAGTLVALLLWLIVGYSLFRSLERITSSANVIFVLPCLVFTGVLLALNLTYPPNEFLEVMFSLWYVPAGYLIGGLLARNKSIYI